jgi:hypothetical protein
MTRSLPNSSGGQGGSPEVVSFDSTQFKIQPDGTFRISIRAMAAMAGIANGPLSQSLKSAALENPLPVAKALLAQGFDPALIAGWGETGGIPEAAAPTILEYYGIIARKPSEQARIFLLGFSRVGINAYLKEKLQLNQQQAAANALPAELVREQFILQDMVPACVAYLEGLGLSPELAGAHVYRNLPTVAPNLGLLLKGADKTIGEVQEAQLLNVTELWDLYLKPGVSTFTEAQVSVIRQYLSAKGSGAALVNLLLIAAGMQEKTNSASQNFKATEKGQKFSKTITQSARHNDGHHTVIRPLWKETVVESLVAQMSRILWEEGEV